jgi:hypothetical protein
MFFYITLLEGIPPYYRRLRCPHLSCRPALSVLKKALVLTAPALQPLARNPTDKGSWSFSCSDCGRPFEEYAAMYVAVVWAMVDDNWKYYHWATPLRHKICPLSNRLHSAIFNRLIFNPPW